MGHVYITIKQCASAERGVVRYKWSELVPQIRSVCSQFKSDVLVKEGEKKRYRDCTPLQMKNINL